MARIKITTGNNNKLSAIFEAFQLSNKNKNLRPASIKSYDNRLLVIKAFLRETQGTEDCNIKDIDEQWLSDFVKWQISRENKPISINGHLKNIRIILKYAKAEGYIDTIPEFQYLKVDEEFKVPYTPDEISRLLKKPTRKYFPLWRTWAAIAFTVGTGCRAGTLVNIRIGDIDFQNQTVRFEHTKSRRYQVVPLPPALMRILKEYLAIRKGNADDFLFPNHSGKQWTSRAFNDALQKYNPTRGVMKTSVHLLRHAYGTEFIKAGGTLTALQKQLGHKSAKTTERYIALAGIELKDSISFNPLQRLYSERIKI